jgi:SAM-dependent methyltransferase
MDPLAGTAWNDAATVAGFMQSPPNGRLIEYANRLAHRRRPLRVLDIGCGAGRNAVPLAEHGAVVVAADLSEPMIRAASTRRAATALHLALAPMDALPVRDRAFDLIVAHGIWNLARSDAEFRRAIREAARVADRGARLFVFTFSRRTLAPEARPVDGERYVFTQFSGGPQVFLTRDQLLDELAAVGFIADPGLPLRELNLPPPGRTRIGGAPIIFEGGFQFAGA